MLSVPITSIRSGVGLMKGRAVIALAALQVLCGCVGGPDANSASGPRMTAIYSPPVRLGGKGSIIYMPAPAVAKDAVERILETPDTAPLPPTVDWLTGNWLRGPMSDASRKACGSPLTIMYERDGKLLSSNAVASWKLQGDRLTETLVELLPNADAANMPKVGATFTHRIKRVGPDEGAIMIGGQWLHMLRCWPGKVD